MNIRTLIIAAAMTPCILTGCGRAPGPRTDPTPPVQATIDWLALDDLLPRDGWALASGWLTHASAGPAPRFLPSIAFDAPWDSLAIAGFDTLHANEQAWRRDAAAEFVQKAFIGVVNAAYPLRGGRSALRFGDERVFFKSLVFNRVLRGLHTAVGTDPTSADAWFHLAYFSGVVGDRHSAQIARARFLDLTTGVEPMIGPIADRRARAVLDEGWDLRDGGLYQECLAWLDAHEADLAAGRCSTRFALEPTVEADLVRGLCHAELGDHLATRTIQARLPAMPVRVRTRHRSNDDLKLWLHAWLDLRTGDHDLAAWRLGRRYYVRRPAALGWRFYQDLGQIAAELGDADLATRFWALAYNDRSYKFLFPQSIHRVPDTGEPDADLVYLQAYRTYFLVGSLWSFASQRTAVALLAGPADRPLMRRQAYDALDACIRRGIQEGPARMRRARLLLQDGRWDDARADLESVAVARLTGGSTPADLAFLTGVAALGTGRLSEALASFEHAVALDQDHARGWQSLAISLAHAGRHDEALAAFDRVERLLPGDGVNHFNRGLLHLQLGQADAARRDLERAATLLPYNPRIPTLLQAVATGRAVTIDLTPQPVLLVATSEETRHAEDTVQNMARLGLTPNHTTPLQDALARDRERGDTTRALAIARGDVPDGELDELSLLLALTILLDQGAVPPAQAVLARAGTLATAGSPVLEMMRDLIARQQAVR